MNGIRLVQIRPKVAEAAGIKMVMRSVESPRGSIKGTALIWEGTGGYNLRSYTFGPIQKMAEELGTPTMKQLTSC